MKSSVKPIVNAKAILITCFLIGLYSNLAQASIFRFIIGNFYGTEIHLGLFLSIWLLGISLGGITGSLVNIQIRKFLALYLFAPYITTTVIYFGIPLLPSSSGSFLPLYSVFIFMTACILPISFIIGMLIPNFVANTGKKLGQFYSIEAIGSFIGGILFSFALNGTADSITTILSLSLLPLTGLIIICKQSRKFLWITFIALSVFINYISPIASDKIEKRVWEKFHPRLTLVKTIETPYQKLQLSTYYGQKSIFSDGVFSCSWPLLESSEKRVHSFVTALKSYKNILVAGSITTDTIKEFLKYSDLNLYIVELDSKVLELMNINKFSSKKVHIINDDPRSYMKSTSLKFDGIFISPVSPVTLVGNRLFTIEAFALMKKCLSSVGVMSLQVSGSENYLGSIKAKIILGTNKALNSLFEDVYAFPGHPITFFASNRKGIIPRKVRTYMERFANRKIFATTFFPQSFFNILLPFRCKELGKWLSASNTIELNSDIRPSTFKQQLELWNIYSGSSFYKHFAFLEKIGLKTILMALALLFTFSAIYLRIADPKSSPRVIASFGVMASGGAGILSEIILILLYQNQYGAAFKMSAFFFGLYMLGLATGARTNPHGDSLRNIKIIKFLQSFLLLTGYFFIAATNYHTSFFISLAIFLIAFLDGIEFPLADKIIKSSGTSASKSAGTLLFMDNFGALFCGLTSGIFLLPMAGMKNIFLGLFLILSTNLILLLFLPRHKMSSLSAKNP